MVNMNTNVQIDSRVAAILGGLIADSASLGLHWLYDTDRIAQIEQAVDELAFLKSNADHYADTSGYFVHGHKPVGDSSGYGELCLLMLKHIAQHKKFDRVLYQTEYRAHFGPGGAFVGFIDTATRLTLRALLPLAPEEFEAQSGADDDQFAALAMLPALVASFQQSRSDLMRLVEQVVRITNNNDMAVAAAQYAATVLFEVIHDKPMKQALHDALPLANEQLRSLLTQALSAEKLDSVAMAKQFGSACHVTQGLPIIVHIAQHAKDYREAIEANIRAGGDNCGRSVMLGAIVAADTAKREPATGIPLGWLAKYRYLSVAADACAVI